MWVCHGAVLVGASHPEQSTRLRGSHQPVSAWKAGEQLASKHTTHASTVRSPVMHAALQFLNAQSANSPNAGEQVLEKPKLFLMHIFTHSLSMPLRNDTQPLGHTKHTG